MKAWCSHFAVAMMLMVGCALKTYAAQQESGTPRTSQGVPPQFVIGDNNVVRLPADTTTLAVTGYRLDNDDPDVIKKLGDSLEIAAPQISRGLTTPGTFKLGKPEFVGRSGPSGLMWRVPVVNAEVPAGTSHMRITTLSLGYEKRQSYALEFSVSAKSPTESQWTPRGNDVWTVSWSDPPSAHAYEIAIENPNEPIANLRLAQSTLKNTSGHTIGVKDLRLTERLPDNKNPCSTDGKDKTAFNVPGNSTRPVYLYLDQCNFASLPFGTFDGVVRLTAQGSAATKDVPIKIQASSEGRRWQGVTLTLLGLGLTFIISALVRPWMARLQARRAAAALRHGVTRLKDETKRWELLGFNMEGMEDATKELGDSISDKQLNNEGLLPPLLASPSSDPTDQTTIALALNAKLDEVSKKIEGLLVLLRHGMPQVHKLAKLDMDEATSFANELNGRAQKVTGPQDARAMADELERAINEAIDKAITNAKASGREIAQIESASAPREVTVSELDLEIRIVAGVAWFIWGLISLATGAAWIFTDPDFGTTVDLVSSFAWGFGMTTFGAGIQSLTPNSVAAQMNVKVPK